MSNLPPEIVTEILYRLPVKSLLCFTSVSKWWYNLIHSSDFIKSHLNHSIKTNNERTLIIVRLDALPGVSYSARFDDDDCFGKAVIGYQPPINEWKDIVGSCNGLVCISNSEKEIAIWNPLIRKYKKLPEVSRWPYKFGFGHDPVNDDYKVVMIVRSSYTDSVFELVLSVYSLRAHSWKTVFQEWPELEGFFIKHWQMEFLNGSLHCLVVLKSKSFSESVLAFDLASETFRMYTPPIQPNVDREIELEVLGGKLCVCVFVTVNEYRTLNDVWVMEEYGVVSSWTKLYTIKQEAVPATFDYCKLMVFSMDGKRVLLQHDYENLFWYDMKEKQSTRVRICDMPHRFQTAICVGSLVLIDGDVVTEEQELEEDEAGFGLSELMKNDN